ncbi:hypothetical protein CPC735_047590 [Paecilomyces variotii No. 5]|uniref:Zn(2)-C6 fungal-type domain-containing protein n=1 Tax=Byssochlamys spectabilis (strain No. 5 / NBRC 109023) TaxID=1356009 RepID=V5GDJ4_BYSSN|nr:hypothetical protein CPC735_047590 [Paecilomyces variotii No. 5]
MVGVAGKSKGCNTCRKRKVACDLQRPQCSQCIKSNRVCTGYQRKRIFIFHRETQQKDHGSASCSSTSPEARSTTSPCQEGNPAMSSHSRGRRAFPRTRNQIASFQSNANLSPIAYRKQIFNAYLCSHIPPSQLQSLGTLWTALVPELVSPTEALETSSLALATSKLGRLNDDPVLTRESLRLYTLALRQLQKALWDPALMYKDETLAACMALAMYEIMECPSGDQQGYMSHCDGLDKLVQLRGPEAHIEGLGHHVFLAFRVHSTLQDLNRHSPSYLSSSEWTSVPWANIPKTEFDQFFDIFLNAPATLQAVDQLDATEPPERLRITLRIIESCWALDSELARFYENIEKTSLGPLYWPEFAKPRSHWKSQQDDSHDGNENNDLNDIDLFPISLHFPNLGTARTVILYWATLAMLWSGLYQLTLLVYALKDSVLESNINNENELELEHETSDVDTDTADLEFAIARLRPLGHRKDFASMARNVCQSVEYCMQDEMLGIGPLLIPAPLGIVIDTMKGYESFQREVRWAKKVMKKISEGGLKMLE